MVLLTRELDHFHSDASDRFSAQTASTVDVNSPCIYKEANINALTLADLLN